MKEPIKLRERENKDGTKSLYLDVYYKGERKYEFLHLYIVPEKNRKDKEKNRETLQIAEAIKAKRIVELVNGEYGFKNQETSKTNFYKYLLCFIERKKKEWKESTLKTWGNLKKSLLLYDEHLESRTFKEIDGKWVEGFVGFLEKKRDGKYREESTKNISVNTQKLYFQKLCSILNKAYEDGVIREKPQKGIKEPKGEESKRMYLSLEEIKLLRDAECNFEVVKRAFLFSCITGLRFSDIKRLRFSDIYEEGEFTRIIFQQKKTGGQEYLDISDEAKELIGVKRKGGSDFVFEGIGGHNVSL
ncbi:MAG TPA: mobilization protein, partial [Porphyromonadaceae bacterium]|nr:mobilization protein [Porphyromonadaceae bacterium]